MSYYGNRRKDKWLEISLIDDVVYVMKSIQLQNAL